MTCPRCGNRLLRDGTCLTHGEPSSTPIAAPITKRPERRRWSDEEKALARALAADPSITGPLLAERLGRPHKGLKHQLARLGISKVRGKPARRKPRQHVGGRPRSHWSQAEIELLEDGETKTLSRSRSKAAIAKKATELGCPLRSGDGCLSLRQVADRWSVRPDTVRAWTERGLLPATRAGRMWRIDPGDAERVVPRLKRMARANHGRKGWWAK